MKYRNDQNTSSERLRPGFLVWFRGALTVLLLAGLYYISFRNYLLFHALAESFSIVIAFALFSLAWNAREYMEQKSLVHLGIAYAFIGILDLFHTLGYRGMGVFPDYDFYANQLWIAARAVEAFTLLTFTILADSSRLRRYWISWSLYTAVTGLLLSSIFVWKIFPICFVEGAGQTQFKLIGEYAISLLLLISLVLLYVKRGHYNKHVSRYLMASFGLTILSEISFTFYVSNYGLSNLIGHYLKIFSFYCIYRAIIIEGLRNPLSLFMTELNVKNTALEDANGALRRILSIIGHDLRNSVSGIANLAELLADGYCEGESERSVEILQVMRNSAKHTGKTLELLLDWTRTQAGTLEAVPEIFSVSTVIEDVMAHSQAAFVAKGITAITEGESGVTAMADQLMFRTVLNNLVDNALKFTDRNGMVKVSWQTRDDKVILSVQDGGVGISSELIDSVHGRKQIKSSRGTSGEKGTGLGLGIVRSFVALNNGTLEIDSETGKGSVFRTIWPASTNEV